MSAPILTPRALQDLDGIRSDIAVGSRKAAERMMKEFKARFELLATFPLLGTPRDEIAPNLRYSVLHPYVIYYRPSTPSIEILRVVHGRRDIGGIFHA